MARPLRLEVPGALYHVSARGTARQASVLDDKDRQRVLDVLARTVSRLHLLLHAYCLMDNHYHLLVETPEANLSKARRQLNGVSTQALNRRHGRVGHVLQGRFKALVVDRASYLLELCRYVVLNPVRARSTRKPETYGWSRYRATAGLAPTPPFLTVDWLLSPSSGDSGLPLSESTGRSSPRGSGTPPPGSTARGRCCSAASGSSIACGRA